MARLAMFPVGRGWPEWRDGPARAPALPGVLICHDGSCGFLLGCQAQCGELREVTWFVVVSFVGALPEVLSCPDRSCGFLPRFQAR